VLRISGQGTGAQGAEIADFRAEREPSGAVSFITRIKNTGDLSVEPEVRVRINNSAGMLVGSPAPATLPAIQAGAEGVIPIRWNQVLDPGEYSAVVSVQYAEKKPAITRGARFVVPQPGEAVTKPATRPAASPATASKPADGGAERGQP